MPEELDPNGYRANKEAIWAKARELAERDLKAQEALKPCFGPEERKLRLERLVKLHVYNITVQCFECGIKEEANGS